MYTNQNRKCFLVMNVYMTSWVDFDTVSACVFPLPFLQVSTDDSVGFDLSSSVQTGFDPWGLSLKILSYR